MMSADVIDAQMTAAPGAEQPYGLKLRLLDEKPPALHHGGYITYGAEGPSSYYSRTRLAASGLVQEASGATVNVSGLAWADHQWGDFVISGTVGWEWFSIQLDNNTELMLYVLRDRAGATSAVFGSRIMPNGTVQDIGPVRGRCPHQWRGLANGCGLRGAHGLRPRRIRRSVTNAPAAAAGTAGTEEEGQQGQQDDEGPTIQRARKRLRFL
jgi:hypothetical protein